MIMFSKVARYPDELKASLVLASLVSVVTIINYMINKKNLVPSSNKSFKTLEIGFKNMEIF